MTTQHDPQGNIVVNLDPGGVSGALIAAHEARYDHDQIGQGGGGSGHEHTNLADLEIYDPNLFDPSGRAAEEMAAHLMELDPHNQYALKSDLADAGIVDAPIDDNIYVRRNGQWEILDIS